MGNRSSRSRRRSSVHRQAYAAEGPPPPPYKGSDRHPNDKEQYLGADQKHNPLSIATSYGPSPTQGATTSTVLQQSGSISGSEDALEVLRKYDIVVLMDDSFSMSYDNMKSWNEARSALATLADKAGQYDGDGIDVYFLNSKRNGVKMRNARSVLQLFDQVKPGGATPIGDRLEELLMDYMEELERVKTLQAVRNIKPLNIIVITDGAPTDDPESVIVAKAKQLDKGHFPLKQVGIQFVQVGADPSAAEFLRELDDGLAKQHNIRDIVDTTPSAKLGKELSAESLVKILLGGINRRVDTKGGASV